MKNISLLSEKFQLLEVKFSIYLKRRVFVMWLPKDTNALLADNEDSDAQADLIIRCTHLSECTFSHVMALFDCYYNRQQPSCTTKSADWCMYLPKLL